MEQTMWWRQNVHPPSLGHWNQSYCDRNILWPLCLHTNSPLTINRTLQHHSSSVLKKLGWIFLLNMLNKSVYLWVLSKLGLLEKRTNAFIIIVKASRISLVLSLFLFHPVDDVTQPVLPRTQDTSLLRPFKTKWRYFCRYSLCPSCTSLNTFSLGPNSFNHLKPAPPLLMSPSCLWPWPGLLQHPVAECVWMDTFPGCSLIDASVDARGLMHFHSLLAFPANPVCRLPPPQHEGHGGGSRRKLDVMNLC